MALIILLFGSGWLLVRHVSASGCRRDHVAHCILARQAVQHWSTADLAAEAVHGWTGTVHLLAVEHVAAVGLCAASVQVRLRYTTTLEGRTRLHGHKNYRPISNLTVISKLLERVILWRLLEYLNNNCLSCSLPTANLIRRRLLWRECCRTCWPH